MARQRIIEQEPPFALRTPDGGLVPARSAAATAPTVPGSPTALQLRLIHVAARQAGLDEAGYRMALRNVCGVESSKQLDQVGVEDFLSLCEDRGWRDPGRAPDHWRSIVATRGSFCGSRMAHKIEELSAKQRYALPGLCQRFSNGRTERVDRLGPAEAWALIEALKEIVEREGATPTAAAKQAAGGNDA